MTPLEEFRLWLRQGPTAERVVATIAAVVALGLIIWVAVPPGNPSTGGTVAAVGGPSSPSSASPQAGVTGPSPSGSATSSGAAGAASTAASGATASAPAAGGATSGLSAGSPGTVPSPGAPASGAGPSPSGSGAGTGASGAGRSTATTARGAVAGRGAGGGTPAANPACGPAGSTDQGVTATTVHVGVMVLNIENANSAIGVPTTAQEMNENQAFVNWINSHGGVKCRKVIPTYYTDNPLDSNAEHSLCIQVLADKVFSVIGNLYSTANITCLPSHQIPVFGQTGLPYSFSVKFFPYFNQFYNDSLNALKNMVLGAKQEGWFNDNGLGKIGVLEQDCYPEYTQQVLGPLASIAIPSSRISAFDYGCNSNDALAGPPASEVSAMVLQFRSAGVTHVVDAGYGAMASISVQANLQGFHPKYLTSDVDQAIGITGGTTTTPDPSYNGLAITGSQYGDREAGLPATPGTQQCDSIMKVGNAPLSHDGDGYAGGVCDQWMMWYQGFEHAPSLVRSELSAGYNAVGHYDLSYPGGPSDWTIKGVAWASNYWRASVYVGACKCWKVTDPTYHPGF